MHDIIWAIYQLAPDYWEVRSYRDEHQYNNDPITIYQHYTYQGLDALHTAARFLATLPPTARVQYACGLLERDQIEHAIRGFNGGYDAV